MKENIKIDQLTDMQILEMLAPNISKALNENTLAAQEAKKRALSHRGFNPLKWMQGCF